MYVYIKYTHIIRLLFSFVPSRIKETRLSEKSTVEGLPHILQLGLTDSSFRRVQILEKNNKNKNNHKQ